MQVEALRIEGSYASDPESIDHNAGEIPLPGDLRWEEAPLISFPGARPTGSAEPLVLEGRFLWCEGWLFARLTGRPLMQAANGVFTLYLDPLGDGESYAEVGVDRTGGIWSRIARKGRTGTKFDLSWSCPGAEGVVSAGGGRVLALPVAALGSVPVGEGWKIGAAVNADFSVLRMAPPLIPLLFRGQ